MDNRKRIAEYVVREVARRVVPMALTAIGDNDCNRHASRLENLADDASMADVILECDAAQVFAYAAGRRRSARDNAWVAAARAASGASAAAFASDVNDYATSAYYAGGSGYYPGDVGVAEYENILGEAQSLFAAG